MLFLGPVLGRMLTPKNCWCVFCISLNAVHLNVLRVGSCFRMLVLGRMLTPKNCWCVFCISLNAVHLNVLRVGSCFRMLAAILVQI